MNMDEQGFEFESCCVFVQARNPQEAGSTSTQVVDSLHENVYLSTSKSALFDLNRQALRHDEQQRLADVIQSLFEH